MGKIDHSRFENLTFEDFRRLARDPNLSRHEKVGFPDEYREGKEHDIFADIKAKLTNLSFNNKTVLEIGPGCSLLPIFLSELCKANGNKLIFIDSEEMLSHLPDAPHISKFIGAFPAALADNFDNFVGKVDVILAYSVIQYVFSEGNLWDFLDQSLLLLAEGGEILFGDIPNSTMRKRFFSSQSGRETHRNFTGRDEEPFVEFNRIEPRQIDDSVVLSILARARAAGFHAWVVPQSRVLPMANRREDILIRRP